MTEVSSHTHTHTRARARAHTHTHTDGCKVKEGRKCLFNDALNTFYLRLHGRKEMFYLTTHSTHFIYGYMASDIW